MLSIFDLRLAFFLAKPADARELLECYLGIKRFASL